MGDKVSNRKLAGMGLASLALAVAAISGSMMQAGQAKANDEATAVAEKGRQLFNDWSCGSCHELKDAGGTGHVGPKLDGTKLTKEFVLGRVTNGQGAMPSFGGMLTDEEIDQLATYISAESNK
ncbi:c-type cytochrome [Altererythrobacter fulvus]|uniref:c-type cytochrome n=1 Tax=Caenibius fulvus TaxID=2126012 RepID=UPI000BD37471|nr:MAG: hypothetical protein B7Y87_03725 [Sphingomonadales bacterium 32-64-22]